MVGIYYRIRFDPDVEGLWFLGEPRDEAGNAVDARLFTKGKRYSHKGMLFVPQREHGRQVDFSFGAFDMVVVKRSLLDLLDPVLGEGVQRIPVTVDSAGDDYEILNVLDVVECLDEELSEFTRWTDSDGRPDKVGQYRMVTRLIVDPGKAAGHKIFRVKGWEIALIVNDEIKEFLEKEYVADVHFRIVSGMNV